MSMNGALQPVSAVGEKPTEAALAHASLLSSYSGTLPPGEGEQVLRACSELRGLAHLRRSKLLVLAKVLDGLVPSF